MLTLFIPVTHLAAPGENIKYLENLDNKDGEVRVGLSSSCSWDLQSGGIRSDFDYYNITSKADRWEADRWEAVRQVAPHQPGTVTKTVTVMPVDRKISAGETHNYLKRKSAWWGLPRGLGRGESMMLSQSNIDAPRYAQCTFSWQ